MKSGILELRQKPSIRSPFWIDSIPLPDIHKVAGNRLRHRGRDKMGAALKTLAALKIAVRGRGAALTRRQLVRVHRSPPRRPRLISFSRRTRATCSGRAASRASLPVAHVDSVAQFVRRRKIRAGRNGRRVAGSPAARSGRGTRSVATRVRGGGYGAERRDHFLYTHNAG